MIPIVNLLRPFLLLLFWVLINFSYGQQETNQLRGQIIVKLKEGTSLQGRQFRRSLSIKRGKHLKNTTLELWEFPDNIARTNLESRLAYIDYLNSLPEIEYAEPDYLVSITETTPNDPEFGQQWALKNTGQNGCKTQNSIQATLAWDIQTDCDSLPIGIIDTGIDWTHPDLIYNIWQNLGEDADGDSTTIEWNGTRWILDPGDLIDQLDNDGNGYINDLIGWDFVNDDNNPMDDDGHGTHVAGIIGARGNNNIGISGVCWNARLMPLKGLNQQGTGYVSDLIQAIDYSVQMGAKITNNSWSLAGQESLALYDAILAAQEEDQLFITAAGNNGTDNDVFPVYPASYNLTNIFTVGAATCQYTLPEFSNYGETSVDIMAPGDGIYSTQLKGGYRFKSGTSMAAPYVAGAVALMANKFPYSSSQQLKELIMFYHTSVENFSEKCVAQGVLNLESLLSFEPNINSENEVWLNFPPISKFTKTVAEGSDAFWLGTPSGIIRIDKSSNAQSPINTSNSGIPSNDVKQIIIDGQQNLWVTFFDKDGVAKREGAQWTFFDGQNSPFSGVQFNDMAVDQSNQLWMATSNGLYKFDQSNWILISDLIANMPQIPIEEIEIDQAQQIWFISKNPSRLTKFDGSNLEHFDSSNSLIGNNSLLSELTIDNSDNIWLVSRDSLLTYQQSINNWTAFTQANSPGFPVCIRSVSNGPNGSIYVSCGPDIFTRPNPHLNVWTSDSPDPGSDTTSELLLFDSEERIWVRNLGELDVYTYLFDQGNWLGFEIEDNGLGGGQAGSIAIGANDYIWITGRPQYSIDGGWGVSRYDRNSWQTYTSINSDLPSDTVYQISADTLGNIWMGTHKGLAQLKPDGNWEIFTPENSEIPGFFNYAVFVDRKQRVWTFSDPVGPVNSLDSSDSTRWAVYDQSIWKEIPIENPPSHDLLHYQIMDDSKGNVWIGTLNGVVRVDSNLVPEPFTTTNSGIPTGNITHIAIDKKDNIWLGDYFGGNALIKYDGNRWEEYKSENSALSDSPIYTGLAIDSRDHIWISTYNDLLNFDGTNWTIYNSANSGLPNDELHGIAIDKNDRIWIGTSSGLAFLDPGALISFSSPGFTICLNEPVTFQNESSPQNIINFEWQVNGGFISSDTDLTYTFTKPGVYEITLIANDSIAGQRAFSQFITAQAPIQIDLGSDTTACAEQIYLDAGIVNAIYAWENEMNDTLSFEQGLSIDTSGKYYVSVTDACGFTSRDTISATLTEDPIGSCVWPGDVDANGWVNMIDFLVLGAENGASGLTRPNASLDFTSQAAPDWNTSMIHQEALGVDMKHADCNGDGIIEIGSDREALFTNAQGAYRVPASGASANNRLRIRPSQIEVDLGDTISYQIFLDNAQSGIVPNAYGLAFNMQHNLSFRTNPTINCANSWLGVPGQDLECGYIRYPFNFDVGLTRDDQFPVSDSGEIAQIDITILEEDIEDTSKFVKRIFVTMKGLNAVLMERDGNNLSVNSLTANTMETVTMNLTRVSLDLKVWLQGAYEGNKMHSKLRDQGLLSSKHPYGSIYQSLPDSIPEDAVDWVLVELRYPENPAKVVAQRAAWLLSDGSIVDPEGGGPLSMLGKTGFFLVSIKHRNHLSIMSSTPLLLSTGSTTEYDFSEGIDQAFGVESMTQLPNGKWAMYSGDVNNDGKIAYSGPQNDRSFILSKIGGIDPTHIVNGYHNEDLNLDGQVKYSGSRNDRAIILANIGFQDPTKIIIGNVP